MKIKNMVYVLIVLGLIALSGCSEAKPAGLSDDALIGIADNILKAVDANDFSLFSQDLSEQMKAAFSEAQFNGLHDMLLKASGHYQSLDKPALTNNQGYAIYRFPATYENETVYVTLTFLVGGDKVEGFFLDSPNLREVPK
jgi:hypothetical protein